MGKGSFKTDIIKLTAGKKNVTIVVVMNVVPRSTMNTNGETEN